MTSREELHDERWLQGVRFALRRVLDALANEPAGRATGAEGAMTPATGHEPIPPPPHAVGARPELPLMVAARDALRVLRLLDDAHRRASDLLAPAMQDARAASEALTKEIAAAEAREKAGAGPGVDLEPIMVRLAEERREDRASQDERERRAQAVLSVIADRFERWSSGETAQRTEASRRVEAAIDALRAQGEQAAGRFAEGWQAVIEQLRQIERTVQGLPRAIPPVAARPTEPEREPAPQASVGGPEVAPPPPVVEESAGLDAVTLGVAGQPITLRIGELRSFQELISVSSALGRLPEVSAAAVNSYRGGLATLSVYLHEPASAGALAAALAGCLNRRLTIAAADAGSLQLTVTPVD